MTDAKIFPPRRLLEKSNSELSKQIDSLFELGLKETDFKTDSATLEKVEKSYDRLMETLKIPSRKFYGIHTFYGENVRNERDPKKWQETQIDLLTYLKVGVGKTLAPRVVRRALRLQAKKVAIGLSSIHVDTYKSLIELSCSDKLPEVPSRGSLGASGDLVTMVHAISPLFEKVPPRGPRDVIGLINTNAIMGSCAIEHYFRLAKLQDLAYRNTALVSHAIDAGEESYAESGLGKGQVHRSNLDAGERIIEFRSMLHKQYADLTKGSEKNLLQPRYSVRCAPQILGNCDDIMRFAAQKIIGDTLAVTDNPLILPDPTNPELGVPWHGGLFYASGIASAGDSMVDVCAKVGELLDRQTLVLMDSNLNGSLPDNLQAEGLSHCKGIHQLMSSLGQEMRALSMPSRLMSFSCEGNNQDLVPCGMTVMNSVERNLDVLEEMVRGALFCSIRAVMIRNNAKIDPRLGITKWSDFTVDCAQELLA